MPRPSAGTGLLAPDMDRAGEIAVIPDVVANVDALAAARAYAAVAEALKFTGQVSPVVASVSGTFRLLTCTFSVELPGIEPGSYGIPSRLLRAQFAMPLLGSPDHANKSG
jgi:hypothetical protein